MESPNPAPEFYGNYARRRKLAVWAVGISGLFGGTAFLENGFTPSAAAATEASAGRDTLPPKDFIKSVNKQVVDIANRLLKSPHKVKYSDPSNSGQEADKTAYKGYYVRVPGDHGRWSYIAGVINQNGDLPQNMTIIINADSKKWNYEKAFEKIYQYSPRDPADKTSSIVLQESSGHNFNAQPIDFNVNNGQSVSNGSYSAKDYSYEKNSPQVAAEFHKFIAAADKILGS